MSNTIRHRQDIGSFGVMDTTHKWMNLALDLLLMESDNVVVDHERLAEAYGLTVAEIHGIIANPEFRKQMDQVREWLAVAGQENPVVYQSAIMATNLKERLFLECMNANVPFADKLKFLQELNKDLPKAPEKKDSGLPTGPVINIQLSSNIRGMAEFTGSGGNSAVLFGNTYDQDEVENGWDV